jgi:dTDP-4-dehydrorhamnose reductase
MGTLRVLITGSNGLLGQKLVHTCLERKLPFLGVSSGENRNPDCPAGNYRSLDLTQHEKVGEFFSKEQFTHVIHTAAMTNVDACELSPELCYAVNHLASRNLFEQAIEQNCHFTLLSTDFVFDGKKGNYSEKDPPNPLSIYGNSKFLAEKVLLTSAYKNWAIARTIIVYGKGYNLNKSNIFTWLIQELSQGREVSLITDHFRAPTWAEDLADGCLAIIKESHKGIFHLAGPETLSIYDIGLRVAQYLNVNPSHVIPIDSNTLSQPAPRPPRTGFNLTKAQIELNFRPHPIEATLDSLR